MSLPRDYVGLTGAAKLELLWKNVLDGRYDDGALPSREPGPIARLKLFSVAFNKGSFENDGDEITGGRRKLLHAHGSNALVRLDVVPGSQYTGLLRGGAVRGLLRLSVVAKGGSFKPSLALKVCIDGRPSVNLFAMPGTDGQGADHDMFARAYSNALPEPRTFDAKMVGRVFQKTAEALGGARLYGVYLPLHQVAGTRADGASEAAPVVPDRVIFAPAIKTTSDKAPDWRVKLAGLAEGTRLFDVLAAPSIEAEPSPLGALTLVSRFVASRYSDEVLWFRHDAGPIGPR